jgi:hypothetical protein
VRLLPALLRKSSGMKCSFQSPLIPSVIDQLMLWLVLSIACFTKETSFCIRFTLLEIARMEITHIFSLIKARYFLFLLQAYFQDQVWLFFALLQATLLLALRQSQLLECLLLVQAIF